VQQPTRKQALLLPVHDDKGQNLNILSFSLETRHLEFFIAIREATFVTSLVGTSNDQ
jgi:hypothetical protein